SNTASYFYPLYLFTFSIYRSNTAAYFYPLYLFTFSIYKLLLFSPSAQSEIKSSTVERGYFFCSDRENHSTRFLRFQRLHFLNNNVHGSGWTISR
ncbi:hypothetical protein LINPERPRIM_LOCUS28688, partial [Linum perenne]